jgi:hypothetical protein
MRRQTKIVVAGASALALIAGGVGVAGATGRDDSEAPIAGRALDRASAAAIEYVGGGRVTETEVGDEESYYEVEVTRPDGGQVGVQLDRDFNVVGYEADRKTERGDDR